MVAKTVSSASLLAGLFLLTWSVVAPAQELKFSNKTPVYAENWVAINGKPLGATAGARIFEQGGNAVDAASAMLAAAATMWDTLGWGGETQALIHNPETGEVVGINALGVAPTGATPEYFRSLGMDHPPDNGPLAAVTPGTAGGLLVMLAEYGSMSLAEVLAPALEMAAGYPINRVDAVVIENAKDHLRQWADSRRVLLPHDDPDNPQGWAAPHPGELFRQPELKATLEKLVAAEKQALDRGESRKEAIMAAYERFYRGDIAEDIVAANQQAGGLFTLEDLANWQVHIEAPRMVDYKGIQVYKLDHWVQGPVMLQMLNMLENFDLQSLGYNSVEYIHLLYQIMSLAFADRDFYYGDPYFPPAEPIEGLLSKDYAAARLETIDFERNSPVVLPGNPYDFQAGEHPFPGLWREWLPNFGEPEQVAQVGDSMTSDEGFVAGTTVIQAADAEGWVVSITPSGGWIPAFIAGETGIGLSQRMQSFAMDASRNPYNVLEPGKRPRATLTPSLAMKDGQPLLSFAAQGGDTQDQNLLQLFLNVVEFDMSVQQATEAANFNSYQVHSSFGSHVMQPGRLLLRADMDYAVMRRLQSMGYQVEIAEKTSGPIVGIWFDQKNGTMVGGASDFGDDTALGW